MFATSGYVKLNIICILKEIRPINEVLVFVSQSDFSSYSCNCC